MKPHIKNSFHPELPDWKWNVGGDCSLIMYMRFIFESNYASKACHCHLRWERMAIIEYFSTQTNTTADKINNWRD